MRNAFAILALLFASRLLADVVHLSDGTRVEGVLKREPGGWVVTDAAGKATHISDDRVASIEKTSNLSPADLAAGKLASLRRAVENVADLGQIIDRYKKFIEQNPNTAIAKDAARDLDVWKDRQARNLVKVGTSWMTADEQAVLLEKSVAAIDKIREQIKGGKPRDAELAINQLLAIDPNNVSGLYLRGVVAYRQDQIPVAKKSFDRVRELLPDHGPTLNNLAVLNTRQHQPGAVALYDLAMLAAPRTRQILDNTAEALNAVPNNQRETQTYKNAKRHFDEQDSDLQKQLAKEGLVRWGSGFVPQARMDELKKAEEKIKDKLDALAQEYDKINDRIHDIDGIIASNNRSLDRLLRDYTIMDSTGRVTQLRLPGIYFDIRRDNDKLRDEQRSVADKLDTFQERALRIRQEAPVPQYSGLQRLIEVEGTPLAVAKPAAKGGEKPGAEPKKTPKG
jgi:tetratricopeptide (TPR) repeat protein